jgi:electron transfer flavoprotein alpha subunit
MGKILVYIEHSKGKIKRSSQELLSAAHQSNYSVAALAIGSNLNEISTEASRFGVTELFIYKSDYFDFYNPETYTNAVVNVLKELNPSCILAPSSSLGKDLFPRVAAQLDIACISDCMGLSFNNGNPVPVKSLYSGKCLVNVDIQNSSSSIILMRANQLPIIQMQNTSTVQIKEMSLPPKDLTTLIKDIVKGTSEKLDLTEANIIVSGGRGLKEAANFKLLNELADSLGATVGATRAVVDAGWVSHEMQVGQTGKTVAPTLYIAVGISGAIQHLAGMTGSKVIVAINSDPNAPIFQKSTYGIVGDLFEVLPKLTEEFKKALHH